MTNDQLKLLDQSPPAHELRSRRASDGTALTYVEGRYIAEMLNAIFGPDGWSRQFTGSGLKIAAQECVERDGQQLHQVSVTCEYRLTVGDLLAEDVGFGQSGLCSSLGSAIESASKESVTDAMKRCARTIGRALGSCLYDKAWLAIRRQAAAEDGQSPDKRWQELEDRLNDINQDGPTDADYSQLAPEDISS